MEPLPTTRTELRAYWKWLRGKGVVYRPEVAIPTERHGSLRHGWTIHPDIDHNSVVYSFGIGQNISFDLSLIRRYGVEVHAFDPTDGVDTWLKGQSVPPKFRYYPIALSNRDGTAMFFSPTSGRSCCSLIEGDRDRAPVAPVQVRRLSSIMRELGHTAIDILKIDIEGAEYDVIDDLVASKIQVRQFLVEFHHRFPTIGTAKTRRAVTALRRAGFQIFWASPRYTEFAFIKRAK